MALKEMESVIKGIETQSFQPDNNGKINLT